MVVDPSVVNVLPPSLSVNAPLAFLLSGEKAGGNALAKMNVLERVIAPATIVPPQPVERGALKVDGLVSHRDEHCSVGVKCKNRLESGTRDRIAGNAVARHGPHFPNANKARLRGFALSYSGRLRNRQSNEDRDDAAPESSLNFRSHCFSP